MTALIPIKLSRPDPERSTRGNRRVPLNRSQFSEAQTKARKAFDILAFFFKTTYYPFLEVY